MFPGSADWLDTMVARGETRGWQLAGRQCEGCQSHTSLAHDVAWQGVPANIKPCFESAATGQCTFACLSFPHQNSSKLN